MAAPWAVEALQPLGFFLSGLVPMWFGADAIILQRIVAYVDTGALQLQSESANLLAAAVISGYQAAR